MTEDHNEASRNAILLGILLRLRVSHKSISNPECEKIVNKLTVFRAHMRLVYSSD